MTTSLTNMTYIIIILGSALSWYSLYIFFNKITNKSAEWNSRIVAAIHACLVSALAFICILQGPNPLYSQGEENTTLHNITLVISLGYFIYDFLWCINAQTEPFIMIIHHIASLCSISLILFNGCSGAEAIAGIGSMEITNPLLQCRWFLRSSGYNKTPIHTIVEILFIACFIILRLGYGSCLAYAIVLSNTAGLDVKICSLLLYSISWVFLYFMSQFILKKYFNRAQQHCHDFLCETDVPKRRGEKID